jgi:hypothetical protein
MTLKDASFLIRIYSFLMSNNEKETIIDKIDKQCEVEKDN